MISTDACFRLRLQQSAASCPRPLRVRPLPALEDPNVPDTLPLESVCLEPRYVEALVSDGEGRALHRQELERAREAAVQDPEVVEPVEAEASEKVETPPGEPKAPQVPEAAVVSEKMEPKAGEAGGASGNASEEADLFFTEEGMARIQQMEHRDAMAAANGRMKKKKTAGTQGEEGTKPKAKAKASPAKAKAKASPAKATAKARAAKAKAVPKAKAKVEKGSEEAEPSKPTRQRKAKAQQAPEAEAAPESKRAKASSKNATPVKEPAKRKVEVPSTGTEASEPAASKKVKAEAVPKQKASPKAKAKAAGSRKARKPAEENGADICVEEKGNEPSEEEVQLPEKKSFARRFRPATSLPAKRWDAIRAVFYNHLANQVKSASSVEAGFDLLSLEWRRACCRFCGGTIACRSGRKRLSPSRASTSSLRIVCRHSWSPTRCRVSFLRWSRMLIEHSFHTRLSCLVGLLGYRGLCVSQWGYTAISLIMPTVHASEQRSNLMGRGS